MLDAGSASGGGTYSRDRAILWLFNAQERARVSCVLMQQHALDCVRCSARLDFRQSNLRLRKHQQSCSIALSTHSIHINAQNVLIGAVEWGWSRLLHTIEEQLQLMQGSKRPEQERAQHSSMRISFQKLPDAWHWQECA